VILELDLGNTRGKWRMLADGRVVARGVGMVADWSRGELPSEWVGVARTRAASVLAEAAGAMLSAVLQKRFSVVTEFARSTAECAGVRSAYEQAGSLGVDRWLGIVAAYAEFKRAVVVVSAGTALTIDWVDAVGMHRGGYIIPGARLMAEALLRSTDRVRFDGLPLLASAAPGRETGDCVYNGIALALAGAVQLALTQARAALGDVQLVFAGGDAATLSGLLADEVVAMRPDLVLDGLRLALP
jgi:type III pantothenate kinase